MPAWLNDPIYYHNRGNSTFANESSHAGRFLGPRRSDDREPARRRGDDRHLRRLDRPLRHRRLPHRHRAARRTPNSGSAFVPAMLARAKAKGIPNFHIFGEVVTITMRPGAARAAHASSTNCPAVLDFAFRQAVIDDGRRARAGTDAFERLFDGDALYARAATTAAHRCRPSSATTTTGRFAHVRRAGPSRRRATPRCSSA